MPRLVPEGELLLCADCGASDVQIAAWVNPNTGRVACEEPVFDINQGPAAPGSPWGVQWCPNCQNHTQLKVARALRYIEPSRVASLYVPDKALAVYITYFPGEELTIQRRRNFKRAGARVRRSAYRLRVLD